MFHLVGQIFVGLIIGTLAKLIVLGGEAVEVIVMAMIGIAGSALATVLAHLILGTPRTSIGWMLALLGAVLAVSLYRWLTKIKTRNASPIKTGH